MAVATPFIQDTDLVAYMPDVLTFGIASFAAQNLLATNDVVERLTNEWWPNAIGNYYGFTRERVDMTWPILPAMDIARINTTALKQLVTYRALSHYIMPMLSSDADANGDLFTRRMDRYYRFHSEEWKKVIHLPLYDFNADSAFTQIERAQSTGRRLARA